MHKASSTAASLLLWQMLRSQEFQLTSFLDICGYQTGVTGCSAALGTHGMWPRLPGGVGSGADCLSCFLYVKLERPGSMPASWRPLSQDSPWWRVKRLCLYIKVGASVKWLKWPSCVFYSFALCHCSAKDPSVLNFLIFSSCLQVPRIPYK